MTKIVTHCQRYIGLSLCVVLFSACANISSPVRLYEGTKKSDSEIAKFLVPSALEVVAIDGKELEIPYVPGGQYQLEVLPGDHTLKVIYAEFWGDFTSGVHVTSDAFYFQLSTTAGSTYVFKHNGPEDVVDTDFSILISEIKIWLEQRETGQTINAVSKSAYGSVLTRAIRQAATGTEEGKPVADVSALHQNTGKIAPAISPSPANQNVSSALTAEQIVSQQNALDRLKFWWKLADEKQRKAFKLWIKE